MLAAIDHDAANIITAPAPHPARTAPQPSQSHFEEQNAIIPTL